MPSQIYKDYQSRNDTTLNTMLEGDSGHVDLMSGFSQADPFGQAPHHIDLDTNETADLGDTQGSLLSSVNRQQFLPRTPAAAGTKHHGSAHSAPPQNVADTPGSGLTNILGTTRKPRITNSQLFEDTQAPSSPVHQDPRSDPGDTRPSPDFGHGPSLVTSPPSAVKDAASSPTKTGEPNERYTSMDESQRRRRSSHNGLRILERTNTRVAFDTDDDSYGSGAQVRSSPHQRWTTAHPVSIDNIIAETVTRPAEPLPLPNPDNTIIDISDSSPAQSVDEYDEFSEAVIRSQKSGTAGDASPCPSSHHSLHQRSGHAAVETTETSQQQPEIDSVVLDSQPPVTDSTLQVTSHHEQDAKQGAYEDGMLTRSVPCDIKSQAAGPRRSGDIRSTPPVPESSHHPVSTVTLQTATDDARTSINKDAPASEDATGGSIVPVAQAVQIDLSTNFQTAPSQIYPSTSASQRSYDSPRRAAGVRRMTDIAEDPPPSDVSNVIMSSGVLRNINVFTKDDQDFLDIVQAVPKPHVRRVGYGRRGKTDANRAALGSESTMNGAVNVDTARRGDNERAKSRSNLPNVESEQCLPLQSDAKSTNERETTSTKRTKVRSKRKRGVNDANSADQAEIHKRVRVEKSLLPYAVEDQVMQIAETAMIDPQAAIAQPDKLNYTEPLAVSPGHHEHDVSESKNSGPTTWDPRYRHRVLAPFRSTIVGVFPATCTAMMNTVDGGKCIVKFDDGNESKLEPHLVGAFDLRIGDLVKVDESHLRSKIFEVVELIKSDRPAEEYVCTDVHGNTDVRLVARTRASIANQVPEAKTTRLVSLAKIYLTSTMWPKYHDRVYQAIGHLINVAQGPQPSSNVPSTQATPRGKARRDTLENALAVPTTIPSACHGGIFTNMAFALTFEDTNKQTGDVKQHTMSVIRSLGGHVIDGFNGLFESSGTCGLSLTQWASSLGFVALITDKHSRREKFIQALALGLPCLSHRWVTACVKAERPVSWERYLLPAGESKLLDTVRSRILPASPVAEARLSQSLARRDRLLDRGGVLIIPPKNAKDKDQGTTFTFLAFALGADRVTVVGNLDEVAELLDTEPGRWDWVHYEDAKQQALHTYLHPQSTARPSRNRADDEALKSKFGSVISQGELGMSARTPKCRFVTKEFVVQSIILGSLVED